MIDWSSIPFVQRMVKKERIAMSINEEIESLKSKIAYALASGESLQNDAEDRANQLSDIAHELETITSELSDNESALESIEENLDTFEAKKNEAEELGVYV